MKPAPYPETFFVVHHRFQGSFCAPEGTWGDIGDGFVTSEDDVIEVMIDAWADEPYEPDATDFRVWQIVPGKPAEDCTAWAIRTMIETIEERTHDWN